ncbi:MAG: asparagine--tRNA ligase [archaeon]
MNVMTAHIPDITPQDLNTLRQTHNRFSVLNSPIAQAVNTINSSLYYGASLFAQHYGYTWIEVPTITKVTGACENVDTLHAIDYHGAEAYLAQTGQLYLEAAMTTFDKVYTSITSSRAEKEKDKRHLNQFTLLEIEQHGPFEELLPSIENMIKHMLFEAKHGARAALQALERYDEICRWLAEPFARITYTDAIHLLQGTEHALSWGDDFKSEHEQYIIQELGNKPTFITHFPKAIKFFNMRQNDDNPDIVNSSDLIMPYSGETVGAAERENNYDRLVERLQQSEMFKKLKTRGKSLDDFEDYLTMVKENPILHSGCGIGFGRLSQAVLGVDDIRIATPYPLQPGTLY